MNLIRTICLSSLVSALALAGCSAPQETTGAEGASFAMGQFSPGPMNAPATRAVFPLGAGDALGREIFTYYVACLNAYDHYATGANRFPDGR